MKVEMIDKSKKVWSKGWEILLLTGSILSVCALFMIPTIFYALPPFRLLKEPKDSLKNHRGAHESNGSSLNLCDHWSRKNYTGEICLNELIKLQPCYASQIDVAVRVPADTNQEEAEATAKRLLQGLPLLSPSPECEAAIRPFLCLYLFGSCDSDNQPRRGTQADCKEIRDDVCAREWALAETYLGQGVLPECETLLNEEDKPPTITKEKCRANQSRGDNSADLQLSTNTTHDCAGGYYLSESGVCRPLCSLWTEPAEVDADYVGIIAAVVICLPSSFILIIMALIFQRKNMLTFPTYYLIYLCITAILIAVVVLIGLVSRGKLFCTSNDLLETFANENAYCTFSGIVFTYGMSQLGIFILFHAVGLFWGVVSPFHYRKFKAEGKLKYVHIATVLIALLLPLVPALLHLKEGYVVANSPTVICYGRSIDVTFFSFVLPLSIILVITTSILIVMFWIIFKKLVLKKLILSKSVKSKQTGLLKKAEAKILFIMCYYVLVGTLVLTLFTYFEATKEAEFQAIETFFICQSSGLESGNNCGDTPQVHLAGFDSLSALAIILIGLLPSIVIAFTLKCEYRQEKSNG